MSLVLVPAKPLTRAKARLAPVLQPDERRALCLAMLADVCVAAIGSGIGPVLVVATDTDAEAVARATGAGVVRDPTPEAGLNGSLAAVIPPGQTDVLIVASDLPACLPEDLAAMPAAGDAVRLAPDASGLGTNALWRRPPAAIATAFGEGSADRHRALAERAGVAFEVVRRPGLAFDVDLPSHLKEAWDAPIGEHTRQALVQMGFPRRTTAG